MDGGREVDEPGRRSAGAVLGLSGEEINPEDRERGIGPWPAPVGRNSASAEGECEREPASVGF
jgi:hypothetical protein